MTFSELNQAHINELRILKDKLATNPRLKKYVRALNKKIKELENEESRS